MISFRCTLTLYNNIIGVWRPSVDNINVISATVSPRRNAVAVSYQNGEVRLYSFPCLEHVDRPYILLGGVATQAAQMAFSSDGRYLVILDSYTRAILQVSLRSHLAEAGMVPRYITVGARVIGSLKVQNKDSKDEQKGVIESKAEDALPVEGAN